MPWVNVLDDGPRSPPDPSPEAIRAAAKASGFMEEDQDSPDLLLARGVRLMLRAAYAIDFGRDLNRDDASPRPR